MVTSGSPVAVTDEYVSYQQRLSANTRKNIDASEVISHEGLPSIAAAYLTESGSDKKRKRFTHGDSMDMHIQVRDLKNGGPCHLGLIVNRSDDTQMFSCRTKEDGVVLNEERSEIVVRLPGRTPRRGVRGFGVPSRRGVRAGAGPARRLAALPGQLPGPRRRGFSR